MEAVQRLQSREECEQFLDQYDNILLDCDGVLWRAGKLLPNIKETLEIFRSRGKRVFFITNNSSKSRSQYREKFIALGIEVEKDQIIPVSFAAADYLQSEHPEVQKAFVVGSQGLCDELLEHGITVDGGQDPKYEANFVRSEADFEQLQTDPEVGAVVVGWDLNFHFGKLSLASLHLQRNPGCLFVATNGDAYDRLEAGNIPGNGCLAAAIACSVGREPINVGKPSRWLIDRCLARHGLSRARTLMVGDRLDTDVMLGKNGGTGAALVLTGCTDEADLPALVTAGNAPDYLLPSLGQVADLLLRPRPPRGEEGAAAPAPAAGGGGGPCRL